MARINRNGRKPPRRRFAGIPHDVMNHPDYLNLQGSAVKLLLELARQYNGHNNGDLCIAFSILRERGFNSKSTISNNIKKLIEAGLVIQTRQGYFIDGKGQCALYALAWQPIDDIKDRQLDVKPTNAPPRAFSLENQKKSPSPKIGQGPPLKSGRLRARDAYGRYLPS